MLIRDPRASLQSRKHREWCPGKVDCDNPKIVCQDLVNDYRAAKKLRRQYPKRFKWVNLPVIKGFTTQRLQNIGTIFRVIRYEEFSVDPYNQSANVFNFFGLNFEPEVKKFLDTHTTKNDNAPWTTFRDSKAAPFHWTKELTFQETLSIQEDCRDALSLWGYREALNHTDLINLQPLMNLNWDHEMPSSEVVVEEITSTELNVKSMK